MLDELMVSFNRWSLVGCLPLSAKIPLSCCSRRAVAELRAAPSLEALMQLLVARAKLLLSLRSVVQAQQQKQVQPLCIPEVPCHSRHLTIAGCFAGAYSCPNSLQWPL